MTYDNMTLLLLECNDAFVNSSGKYILSVPGKAHKKKITVVLCDSCS